MEQFRALPRRIKLGIVEAPSTEQHALDNFIGVRVFALVPMKTLLHCLFTDRFGRRGHCPRSRQGERKDCRDAGEFVPFWCFLFLSESKSMNSLLSFQLIVKATTGK